jgi:hypothetical protein
MSNFVRVLILLAVMGFIVYALLEPLFTFVFSGLGNLTTLLGAL